ncbi:hypothetical protein CAOG_04393 [Capsaspora owczarzaki ATCC 30864]|uniref:Uncharacterized protein n=1 Tax=Capsaspora owczarzaki (strain ATCC 30864) TaxID=595528 RepID=A0A0D2WR78_CAPO3|nr:hypothetical protein CAOG_04393 [Capsaspora owczarzaki ATCC 30864]KJE93638.1 hypothetical protein CAOG_004393 [Capsaspora owczarzaki ATCC 30864]|eukprot:XP_004348221.1 hypothetical protein CAOG_04393 [Capsaspora owczarzaki ATCC 30864]
MGNASAKVVGETVKREYPRVAQEAARQQAAAAVAASASASAATAAQQQQAIAGAAGAAGAKSKASVSAVAPETVEAAKPLVANMNQLMVNTVTQQQSSVAPRSTEGSVSQTTVDAVGKRALPMARDRILLEEVEHVQGRLSIEQVRAIFQLRRGTLTSPPGRNEMAAAGATGTPIARATATAANAAAPTPKPSEASQPVGAMNAMHYLATEDTDPLEKQDVAQALWTPNRLASQYKIPVDEMRRILSYFNDAVVTETARGKKYGTWDPYPKELRLRRDQPISEQGSSQQPSQQQPQPAQSKRGPVLQDSL